MGPLDGLNATQRVQAEQLAHKMNISVEEAAEQLFNFDGGKPQDSFNGGELKEATIVGEKTKGMTLAQAAGIGTAIVVVCAGIGAVVGALAGGVGAGPGAALGAKIGGVVDVALGLGGCIAPREINAIQTVNMKMSNDELIETLKEGNRTNQQILAEIKNVRKDIADIYAILSAVVTNQKEVINLLIADGKKADDIFNLINRFRKENNSNAEKILDAIAGVGSQSEQIRDLLEQILAVGYDTNGAVKQGLAKNNELLTEILKKLTVLGENDKAKVDLLTKILAKVTEDVANDKEVAKEQKKLMEAILAKIEKMNDQQVVFFDAVLGKLDFMTEKGMKAVDIIVNAITTGDESIVNAIEGLGDKGKTALKGVIEAINKNTEVAKGSYDVLVAILGKLDKLGDKADAIIVAISNIATGKEVDLSTIEQLLADIKAQEEANGGKIDKGNSLLTEIRDKLNFVGTIIEGIKTDIQDNHKDLMAKFPDLIERLDKILAKIPDGCNCGDVDLTVIIDKLDLLIKVIKEGGNHEGILDDLDDLLG